MNRPLPLVPLLLAVLTAAGCANLAPRYERPDAPVPSAWPAAAASAAATADAPSSADLDWRTLVTDERLRGAIALALSHNQDLRLAAIAVEQARAAYRIDSAALGPTVTAGAAMSASRVPAQASTTGRAETNRSYSVELGAAAWELDLFGRLRNLQDAALESYFNTEAAQRSTQLALVAEVASAWLTLASDQALLGLAEDTLRSQQATYELSQKRHALGADSALTLAQAESTVQSARRDVAAYRAQVQQDRNALDLLLGTPLPAALDPGSDWGRETAQLVGVPAGLPSTVLERRPDVIAAEHLLKAANADIGAARAARFPSISLTAAAGTASRSLGDLFKGGAWSFAPSISLPIFDGGASQARVRSAELGRDAQLATYDKTVQTAFREVADALAVRATVDERLAAQQALVDANGRAYELAQQRYRGGASSYLEVLDAQRTLYASRQTLITLQLAEQANRVTLFKVLGGGWETSAPVASEARG